MFPGFNTGMMKTQGGGAFDPETNSAIGWYRSTEEVSSNAGSPDLVAIWGDQTTNSNNFTSPADAARLETNANTYDSKNVLYSQDNTYQCNATGYGETFDSSNPLCITFLVIPVGTQNDSHIMIDWVGITGGQIKAASFTGGTGAALAWTRRATAHICSLVYTSTTSEIWIDGVSQDSASYSDLGADTLNTLRIGDAGSGRECDWAEIIQFTDPTKRTYMEDGIAAYWNHS